MENDVKHPSTTRLAGWLLAALAPISVSAQAPAGFTVSAKQENTIAVGMSAAEVRQLLGRPARDVQYGNAPGPIWTYTVMGALFGKTEFNVEFGADGKVIAKGEIVIGSESPNQGTRD